MKNFFTCAAALATVVLLAGGPLKGRAADGPSPADVAWKEFRKAATPPSPPREWSFKRPSDEELATFNQERAGKALAAADLARAFYTRYPADKHSNESRLEEYHLLTAVVQLGDAAVADRMMALQEKLADDPSIDEEERLGMILMAAKSALQGAADDPVPGLLKAKGAFVRAFEMFPKRAEPAAYLLQLAEMLLVYDQADAAKEIVKLLDNDDTDPEVRKAVKDQVVKFNRIGQPVDIAFTAIDGRKVDVANLKGKVVMIDYWATWCGPCIAGLPELLQTYQQWHPKGFEIVGISLDSDEDALKKMVKEREMTWPQFYDRENESNRYAEKYGITGIPTLWLIDKKGKLRYLNARSDLPGKIAKLMAEE